MRKLADNGQAVIYVSHFLEEVLKISDTITVLRNGELVRTGPAAEETRDSLILAMTGRDSAHQFPPVVPPATNSAPLLKVSNLCRKGAFDDISFTLRAGEIVGIAGLVAKLAAQGEAVLLISSEIDEILGLCHRTLVMARGRVVAELSREEMTQDAIIRAAFSGV